MVRWRSTRAGHVIVVAVALGLVLGAAVAWHQLPGIGAGALLYAGRRPVTVAPPDGCRDLTVAGADVVLRGWRCQPPPGQHRATLVWLHGRGDNRASGLHAIASFVPRGYTVIAYDSRAHGESGGDACTYGYYEKHDLRAVIDTAPPGPVVLVGGSLGGAVALQLAAEDVRVSAVVAAETFADLRSIATDRAPFVFISPVIERAFARAESWGAFELDAVSPEAAARHITAPVLLLHGEDDTATGPDHSARVFAALSGPKRLILVPHAGHNEALSSGQWTAIAQWIDEQITRFPQVSQLR